MTLNIRFQSDNFPNTYAFPVGPLSTTWGELLWAALTIGRPSAYHVFRHGPASFHEAIFRLALVRMAVEQNFDGSLRCTNAYAALDPTEKGMVSYFLGMVLCKLFAYRLLQTPWLLHLDVFRDQLNAFPFGRSRPDLVGQDMSGNWHAFESKGRSSVPSAVDKGNAKTQAQRLVSVGGRQCSLHVGALSFFRGNVLQFYWRDPKPSVKNKLELPEPKEKWRFYFEPAFQCSGVTRVAALKAELKMMDIKVYVHPRVGRFLQRGEWSSAKEFTQENHVGLAAEGYRPDGLKVTAGGSWKRPFEPRERG